MVSYGQSYNFVGKLLTERGQKSEELAKIDLTPGSENAILFMAPPPEVVH
jgi:hypothetical protein